MRVFGLAAAWMLALSTPMTGHAALLGVENEASRSSAEQRQSMGWLRLGLAPSARSLEPVARRMGSAPLRALLWLVGSLWWLG